MPTINTHFLLTALNQGTYVLALHGGAVQYKNQVVLLSGPAGSGKSTVTAALIRAGYKYLTDDTIILAEPDLSVRPFPLSLCVKTGSWKVIADFFPEVQDLPTHSRVDGQSMRYLSPSGSTVPAQARPRASHIFFLSHQELRSVGVQPIGKIGVIRRLLSRDWNFIPKRLEREFVSRFVSWIDDVECRSLEFGNPEEAVSVIESELR